MDSTKSSTINDDDKTQEATEPVNTAKEGSKRKKQEISALTEFEVTIPNEDIQKQSKEYDKEKSSTTNMVKIAASEQLSLPDEEVDDEYEKDLKNFLENYEDDPLNAKLGEDIMHVPSFYDNDKQSELSLVASDSHESVRSLLECSDHEYVDRAYTEVHSPEMLEADTKRCIMWNYVRRYWTRVNELNETRKNIIKTLNKQLKKSRKYSLSDVRLFNSKISTIEVLLNISAPAISKLKAHFINGSNKSSVIFQKFKYLRINNGTYSCPYHAEMGEDFERCGNCLCSARLVIDNETGELMPGTFVEHYHDYLVEAPSYEDPIPSKPDRAILAKISCEGDKEGKRTKLNQLLDEKLKEATEYSIEVLRTKSIVEEITELLSQLRLYDVTNFGESETNYLATCIEWIQLFLLHVKIDNVQ